MERPRRPRFTQEAETWLASLGAETANRVAAALNRLEQGGPTLGRPLVDRIRGSRHHNMKELRIGTIRVLFIFEHGGDPLILLGGDKRGAWNGWYERNIRRADRLYDQYRRDNGKGGSSRGPSHGR